MSMIGLLLLVGCAASLTVGIVAVYFILRERGEL